MAGWRPEPFRPSAWSGNPHVQTVAGRFLRPRLRPSLTRERWETPDGDDLVLDFGAEPTPRAWHPGGRPPLVLVLHGLEGNARRGYVLLLHRELVRLGLAAVGLNFRGCAGTPNRTARSYHSGETADVRFVLERLREREPDRMLALAGFSLGGNVLLKLLGELGDAARGRVCAAAAVSVPYDLAAGGRALERGLMGRAYSRFFLRSLARKVERKRTLLSDRVDVETALASPTLRAFDDAVTAPLHGFRDADHYYRESSSAAFVARIRVPTLLVHARDDPFLPWERVPLEAIRANPWLASAFPARGGHVGFVEGLPWRPRFWAERTAAAFLAAAAGRPPAPGRPVDSRHTARSST